jgi:hypothetical protein
MALKNICTVLFLIGVNAAICQTAPEPMAPTSATDGEVKIHNSRRFVFFRSGKRVKKMKGGTKAPEQQGQAIQKQRSGKSKPASREARVFKRHNHFAQKDRRSRGRRGTTVYE